MLSEDFIERLFDVNLILRREWLVGTISNLESLLSIFDFVSRRRCIDRNTALPKLDEGGRTLGARNPVINDFTHGIARYILEFDLHELIIVRGFGWARSRDLGSVDADRQNPK